MPVFHQIEGLVIDREPLRIGRRGRCLHD